MCRSRILVNCYPQIVDPGTQQIPNGLILAHITALDAKYAAQKRTHTIPQNLRNALRDVRLGHARIKIIASTPSLSLAIFLVRLVLLNLTLTFPQSKTLLQHI